MNIEIYQWISEKIMTGTEAWADVPEAIAGTVIPLLAIMLTITIIWQGYNIMRGAGGQYHLLDVFFSSMRVFLVVSLALVDGVYGGNVVALLHELREWLTNLFTGTSNSYSALDDTVTTALKNFDKIADYSFENIEINVMSASNLNGLLTLVLGAIITVVIILYTLVAAVNLIIIDVSLALVIAVGPLFIAALAFNATSTFFNSWLSAVLKYTMTAILVGAVIGFANNIVVGFVNALSVDPETTDILSTAATTVIGGAVLIFLATKAATIGAEVIGSASIQVLSLAKAARAVANPAGAAASAALSTTGKAMGYGGGKAGGYLGTKAANSKLGQQATMSRAMQKTMPYINAAGQGLNETRQAMSQPSIREATYMGARSGATAARKKGLGGISQE